MKKIISVFAMLAVLATIVSSCKTHEKCPAYGQNSKPAIHNKG